MRGYSVDGLTLNSYHVGGISMIGFHSIPSIDNGDGVSVSGFTSIAHTSFAMQVDDVAINSYHRWHYQQRL